LSLNISRVASLKRKIIKPLSQVRSIEKKKIAFLIERTTIQ
jgi:hypothetical protein